VVVFLEQATEVLVGELEEEPEGTGLPGVGLRREAKHLASVDEEEALMDQIGEIQVEVGEEVVVEGLVEGVEAAAEEEAAVVAAAGERRRRRMSRHARRSPEATLGESPAQPLPLPKYCPERTGAGEFREGREVGMSCQRAWWASFQKMASRRRRGLVSGRPGWIFDLRLVISACGRRGSITAHCSSERKVEGRASTDVETWSRAHVGRLYASRVMPAWTKPQRMSSRGWEAAAASSWERRRERAEARVSFSMSLTERQMGRCQARYWRGFSDSGRD
jgi:hypothetical protein